MLDTVRWKTYARNDSLLPGKLRLIDQTRLPEEQVYVELDDTESVYDAIQRLVVRGAPAIGCAAALGLAAAAQHSTAHKAEAFLEECRSIGERLKSARPTAVNLAWAIDRCLRRLTSEASSNSNVPNLKEILAAEANEIVNEDQELCRGIGESGLEIFGGRVGQTVLTHCNAGALAASDYGTALSPVYRASEKGLAPAVFADETRPLLQGARLTAWELQNAGVDVTVICDNMAAQVMREGRIDVIIVGADRIAANGDVANKIGTYGLAILADYHNVPLYVAAPYSTIDGDIPEGERIPIEQRNPEEIRHGFGWKTVPDNCAVYNPAFDVTPHEMISGIITEKGILRPPFDDAIEQLLGEHAMNAGVVENKKR